MKIIGGPFSTVDTCREQNILKVYDKEMSLVGSGRIALYIILNSILKNKNVNRTIWLPAYYCNIGWEIANNLGFIVKYYPVMYEDGRYCIELSNVNAGDVVLFLNYYGFNQKHVQEKLKEVKQRGCTLIEDITHSLLSDNKSCFSDYYFGSLRKWTGVFTGGLLYGDDLNNSSKTANNELVLHYKSFMEDYHEYLNTGFGNRDYFRECFYKVEQIISGNYEDKAMYNRDIKLIGKWNIRRVISKRIQNAQYLIDSIKNKNVLMFDSISNGDVPFFLPIYIEKRDLVCKALDAREIYCSVLWQRPQCCNERCNLYDNEFGLVCDERYSLSDMRRISDVINAIV